MNKLFAILFLFVFVLGGCTISDNSTIAPLDSVVNTANPIETTSTSNNNSVSAYVPPEPEVIDMDLLPEFPYESIDGNYIVYNDISVDDFEAYIDSMCDNGFECIRNGSYSVFLYNDDTYLDIWNSTFSNGYFNILITTEKDNANPSALTNEAAITVIDDDRIFLLSEQTPDGFFEATGVQYFYAPIDRFEYDGNVPKLPENAGYINAKLLVSDKGSIFIDNAISSPQVCDINKDGITDIIVLGYGPTSGVFTITLSVINFIDGVPVEKCSEIYTIDHGKVDIFVNESGMPMFAYKPNRAEKYSVYEIKYDGSRLMIDNLPLA